jgi:hypothetical protein
MASYPDDRSTEWIVSYREHGTECPPEVGFGDDLPVAKSHCVNQINTCHRS